MLSLQSIPVIRNLTWQQITAITIIYYASLVFYRLFLHPLAKFPGPKLAAITRWYEGYYDVILGGQYTRKIQELHKEYGPIIRISPHELHINDPTYFEKLYRQDGKWNKYAWSYDKFTARTSTVFTVEHDIHRRRRAPLNAFFSKANVSRRQALIRAKTNKLCQRISEFAGDKTKTVNLSAAVGALVRDVATEFILGKDFENLDKEDFNVGIGVIFQGSGLIWRVSKHAPWFGPLVRLVPWIVTKMVGEESARAFLAFRTELTQLTKDLMSSASCPDPEAPRTIIHDILAAPSITPEEKTFPRVYDEIGAVTGAAFETTAHVLRIILYYVYTDAKTLNRLRADLATIEDTDPVLSTLEQIPYLTAVIMEGLRLGPGNASRLARIAPDRDLVFEDWRIPAGTPVGMSPILMHVDERLYPDPESFQPERWLGLDVSQKTDKTFAPFVRGTRNCAGMQLAWAELYMVIEALVQRFDFEFDGAGPKDVVCASDRFIIGTADSSGIKAYVKGHDI